MKVIDKLFKRVKTPMNIVKPIQNDEGKVIIDIHKDGEYIEILGHKITAFGSSWEDFIEYISRIGSLELEIDRLKKEVRLLELDKKEMISYLYGKIQESKLLRVYDNKECYTSIQERIYQEILDKATNIKTEER